MFEEHKRIVEMLHILMNEASEEYDTDEGVVDDFTQYVKDWATQRSDAELDKKE
jgi:hemerythrin-like domain-containing protein